MKSLVVFAALVSTAALAQADGGTTLFAPIAQVLQSPRCMNCHPVGDRPLQTDQSKPHKQNITRNFPNLGGSCATCHQETTMPGPKMPPGAPHWNMPPAATPMTFEGKSQAQLCADLKDLSKNGGRTLSDLQHHVAVDPLVLWAFNPGTGRTPPPVTHATFLTLFDAWVNAGGACP